MVAGGPWSAIHATGSQSCALDPAGAAFCWGDNEHGQAGDGSRGGFVAAPVAVSDGHVFASLAAGRAFNCGVTTAGAALCWGENSEGSLGNGTFVESPIPVAVAGDHSFLQVSAADDHACGVDDEGSAWCWGENDEGHLGDGTFENRNAPVRVGG